MTRELIRHKHGEEHKQEWPTTRDRSGDSVEKEESPEESAESKLKNKESRGVKTTPPYSLFATLLYEREIDSGDYTYGEIRDYQDVLGQEIDPPESEPIESEPCHHGEEADAVFITIVPIGQHCSIITSMRTMVRTFSRFAIFVIYAWFGVLKIIGMSPAGPLVTNLLAKTIPWMTASEFILFLGIFEVAIGILFLIPRAKWVAIPLFVIHMIICLGPLILLPEITWQSDLVPTLEGQYIIKNLALIAIVLHLAIEE